MSPNLASKNILRNYLKPSVTMLLAFSVGFMLRGLIPARPMHTAHEIREGSWKYINPLLECEQAQNEIEENELKPIKDRVQNLIQGKLHKEWGDEVSLYFRELNDGLAFTIGRTEHFYPASLLKVPEMMSVLKMSENDPKILQRKIVYDKPELKSAQNTDVAEPLVFGRSYTIEELLRRMIEYSDNVSSLLLEDAVDSRYLRQVYDDLGIADPYDLNDQNKYVLSTESYASFFRILFNASYLTKNDSEKALEYLTKTDYTKGLVSGVPSSIKVAHKFGLRKINGIKQLHDCGIVYYPSHPYLLCVMTSGPVPEYLDTTIGEISDFVYREIDRQSR
ncbi:MAG TPA: serine hydrolase [Thermodesulfovibrionales bacterium]|nr:serine hydrolase [Thermodesulfovibrionales bacterium]